MGFGGGPFGSGASLFVASAVQEALNAILVTFSVEPRATDSADVHDATFPANWTISTESPYDATVRLCQSVERVDTLTVRVLLDGPLSAPATYRIACSTMVEDVHGLPIAPLCSTLVFQTVPPTRLAPAPPKREVPSDLSNPQILRDAVLVDPPPLGTFQINDRGDYSNASGRAYLRKRILRRAVTQIGEYFHLAGYGFAEPQKGTISPDLLRRLQTRAQTQIAREPDVKAVRVSARLASDQAPGIVVLDIRVEDRYGEIEELTVPVRLRTSGG